MARAVAALLVGAAGVSAGVAILHVSFEVDTIAAAQGIASSADAAAARAGLARTALVPATAAVAWVSSLIDAGPVAHGEAAGAGAGTA